MLFVNLYAMWNKTFYLLSFYLFIFMMGHPRPWALLETALIRDRPLRGWGLGIGGGVGSGRGGGVVEGWLGGGGVREGGGIGWGVGAGGNFYLFKDNVVLTSYIAFNSLHRVSGTQSYLLFRKKYWANKSEQRRPYSQWPLSSFYMSLEIRIFFI